MAINSVNGINAVSSLSNISNTEKAKSLEGSFADFLKEALTKVSNLEKESTALTEAFAAGTTDNIHQVLIAAEKADVALQFTMQIRNKILDAYHEIMTMQI